MISGFTYLKRATIIVALFFPHFVFSAPGKTETYKDLIDKAYNLSLQKDRTQAMSLLVNGIKKEEKKPAVTKELTVALEKVATVFYSDKAQQNFELALSLKWNDPNLALAKFNEALGLEPENLSIEVEILRLQIASNDCDKALSRLQNYTEMITYLEELKLVQAQAMVCTGKFSEFQKIKSSIDLKKSPFNIFWQAAEAEYLFRASNITKASEILNALQKIDAQYPEAQYWLWKLGQASNSRVEKVAQKYLSSCKSLPVRQQRQYGFDPNLCRHTTEVESFLKKNNNAEI